MIKAQWAGMLYNNIIFGLKLVFPCTYIQYLAKYVAMYCRLPNCSYILTSDYSFSNFYRPFQAICNDGGINHKNFRCIRTICKDQFGVVSLNIDGVCINNSKDKAEFLNSEFQSVFR